MKFNWDTSILVSERVTIVLKFKDSLSILFNQTVCECVLYKIPNIVLVTNGGNYIWTEIFTLRWGYRHILSNDLNEQKKKKEIQERISWKEREIEKEHKQIQRK